MRLCSVHRCYSTGAKGHRFPNPLKDHTRFREWLERVGNTSLLTLDPVKVYTAYRVCESHFTAADYGTVADTIFGHPINLRLLPSGWPSNGKAR
jgi:hypothetical protein